MSPTIATYIGFIVAALILLWGIVEVGRKYVRREKINPRMMDTWVPFKPNRVDSADEVVLDEEEEDSSQLELRKKAQQNGHYSESKKSL